MDKEMLDILNDLSKKPTTELALQIMELSSENLILEQQCKKQKEVIDKAIELLNKFSFRIETDNRTMYIRLKDLEQGKDLLKTLKEVSE